MSLKTRLSVLSLALCASYAATAAPDYETIVVTADRFDSAPEQQLAVVNTIERVEIEELAPISVVDILERLPGLSVTRTGGGGQSANISIRGSESDHVLVLIDGVRISSATLGSVSFSSLAPEQVERIEVVKGSRAAVWGSDAIGGVVQIFTRRLEGGQWYASGAVGSNNYSRLSAGAGISHGDGRTSLTISSDQSDGFDVKRDSETDDDGYERITAGITGEQSLSEQWQLNWSGQYNTGNYEYDNSVPYSNEADYDNFFWNLEAQYDNNDFSSKLSAGQARDYNDNFRDGQPAHSIYETRRDQLSWINQYQASSGLTLSGGVDYYNESVRGDYAEDERDVVGVFALARADLGAWLLEGVVRYDDVENIDSEVSYNTSVAYRFNDQWRLSASYGTAFKAPTFNDLYWPEQGNPELVSETSENVDLTLNYAGNGYNAYISVFQNKVDDLINWAKTGEQDDNGWDIYKPFNVDKATLKGLELGSDFELFGLQHQLAYTYLDAEDDSKGEQLEGRSEHEFDYSAAYVLSQWDLRVDYHYQGKRNDGDTNYDGNPDFISPYHKVDVSVGYAFTQGWKVRLKANNLLDEEVISNGSYYGPGAEWYLSLSYSDF
ncbi:TonB-dependent receptor domain-containing protein [Ferrimonas kyonanensis]|uniref:TonB-dependent receptor domain-containing protein n=1 Tax=Ferrimonas kyonanensis TaxID=364763 RepID=UPI000403B1A7|nr:TonB-dependent receptor [Ferrimonas kyonanensis]